MAFSFRAGTNWCHDFPKLARESGFCFNVHRTRVRVDWNRISSIDIERVIRERDFLTVDDNVNNVVDYSLESEYDVKILDPNFVKLFRLAQLSVEYLLYCKQYLDHSVIILKDELRLKIEDNVIMKKEIRALEETIKDLNNKMRERNKIIESKLGDSSGELFKCPHCIKTFIAPTFVSAHIARRHGNLSDPYVLAASSPVHEQYRTETEKLHNEIKTLKERLNQTERVIRNESDKAADRLTDTSFRLDAYEKGEYTSDKEREERFKGQQIKYQDEISTLKNMLFAEIRNYKQRESSASPVNRVVDNELNISSFKELIKKQENEIRTLREQLREKLTPDLKDVREKLQVQEQQWKVMNDRLEKQHNLDIENLSTQLKMSQESARQMKELYESKVNELETHSKSQTEMLKAQSMHIEQLSSDLREYGREISQINVRKAEMNSPNKFSSRNVDTKKLQSSKDVKNGCKIYEKFDERQELVCEEVRSLSSHDSPKISKSANPNTRPFLRTENRINALSGSGDFETSEDTESIRNTRKLKHEKKIDVKNDKRNIAETLNPKSLQFTGKEKRSPENSQERSYDENPTDRFRRNTGNEARETKKNPTNVNDQNFGSYKPPLSSSKSSNRRSKTLVRNMKPTQGLQFNETQPSEKISKEKSTSRLNTQRKSMEEPEESENYLTESETNTSESESESVSENEDTEILNPNSRRTDNFDARENFKELINKNPDLLEELKTHLKDVFNNKIRDLGIDPEWNGVPTVTFKQKMETVAHHRNINSKKLNGYNRIRDEILKEISQMLLKRRASEPRNSEKMSPLDKIMNKMQIKTATILQPQRSFESRTPVLKSQQITPREKSSRSTTNLEILPKKMSESDINEIRSEKSTESLRRKDSESQPRITPISMRNNTAPSQKRPEIFNRRESSTEIVTRKQFFVETTDSTSMEHLSQSQDRIEYFSESNDSSKNEKPTAQHKSTKVTSTPNKSFVDVTERSYSSIDEESDNELTNRETTQSLPVSPKNNKSVLKSATGSVGSLVKKKVLFDLEQSLENYAKPLDKAAVVSQASKKLFPEYNLNDEKANDDEWNISNLSDDDLSVEKEKSPSVENIVLKTSQSDKIAEISRKIQDQLSITRQKPVGAIEAMFLAKPMTKSVENDNAHYRSSTSIASSVLESPKKFPDPNMKVPKPAPRTQKNRESDIESDIEELLQMG